MRGSIPGLWDRDLSQRQILNLLSHLGVHFQWFLTLIIEFLFPQGVAGIFLILAVLIGQTEAHSDRWDAKKYYGEDQIELNT